MLYISNGQFGIFLAFIWLGVIIKIIYDLTSIKQKKLKHVYDFIFITFSGFLFLIFMHYYNLGSFRMFLVLGFLLGLLFTSIFLSKTLARFKNLLYNILSQKLIALKVNLKEKFKTRNTKKRDKNSPISNT